MNKISSPTLKIFLVAFLGLITLAAGIGAQSENVFQNSGFEEFDNSNKPRNWTIDCWQPGSLLTVIDRKARQGKYAALIQSDTENDARLIQTVKVEPNTIYLFSGWIATESVPANKQTGANLCVIGEGFVHSQGVTGDTGWQPRQLVFRTYEGQKEVTLGVRLGYFGETVSGKAYFDDLKLEKITDQQVSYEQLTKPAANQPPPPVKTSSPPPAGPSGKSLGYPAGAVLIYLLLFGGLWFKLNGFNQPGKKVLSWFRTNLPLVLFFSMLAAFLARLPLFGVPGMNGDQGWIDKLLFFGSENSSQSGVVTKLFSFCCDLGTAFLIFVLLRKKRPFWGYLIAAVYLFLPPVIYNSAYLGRTDSLVTLIVVLLFYFLNKQKPIFAGALTGLALLLEPSTLILLPLFLCFLFQNYRWKERFQALGVMLAAFVLFLVLLSGGALLNWIQTHYASQVVFASGASSGAANFWTLFRGNNTNVTSPNQNLLGTLLVLTGILGSCFYYNFKKTRGSMAAGFFFTFLTLATLAPQVSGRAFFPCLAFGFLTVGYFRDQKFYFSTVLLSITSLLNMHVSVLKLQNTLQDPAASRAMYILAIVNTLLFLTVSLIFFAQSGRTGRRIKNFLTAYVQKLRNGMFENLSRKPFALKKSDYLAVAAIVLIYCGLIFFKLGSWKTPQTGLDILSPQEGIEVTLGQKSSVRTVAWYDAEGTGQLQIEVFSDGKWGSMVTLSCDDYYVLKKSPLVADGVEMFRLTSPSAAGHLNEIALIDEKNGLIPVRSVSYLVNNREVPARECPLFDEPQSILQKPSYLTSTYFDEIYHGRTAYEFVKEMPVYETTHPPLGKDLLSMGILLFGMNPFGLRFMHTLAGICLIILLFFLGRQILTTRFGAYGTLGLGVLDFMPFVQSRYSTIDTFSVLFMGMMFLFTVKYLRQQSQPKAGKSMGLIALIIFFFALAVSVKWTAVYGFAGVIFSIAAIKLKQYWDYRQERAKLLTKEKPAPKAKHKTADLKLKAGKELRRLSHYFWRENFWPTVFGSLILFLLIAPLTYYLNYIPYLHCHKIQEVFSEQAVQEVRNNQKGMFDYHSKLTDTHPFSSSWWSWPFNFKPLWVYTGSYNDPGKKSSIVSMGNPLIWFLGGLGLILIIYLILTYRRFSLMHLIIALFFSLYLPWLLITRVTFLYHFYPALPLFLTMAAFLLEPFWNLGRPGRKIVYIVFLFALGLLGLFYPVLSGAEVTQTYIDGFLRWFPQDWIF